MPIALYKPRDIPVFVGQGRRAALCTGWNDVESLLRDAPELERRCAIIGTLRGPSGVSPIIRNLALNPSIRNLYLWTSGVLSQTEVGRTGTDILFALWHYGIRDDGTVPGTAFRLEPEIPPDFVRMLIKQVEIFSIGNVEEGPDVPADDVISYIRPTDADSALEARSFPDPAASSAERWPAENTGWHFRGRGVVETWTRLVDAIMRYGVRKGTQFGMRQVELTAASWTIKGEPADAVAFPADWPDSFRLLTGTSPKMIEGYLPQILTGDAGEKTYGCLLRRYPTSEGELDQIAVSLIGGLRSSPDCRRAVATTLIPEKHAKASDPPCLNLLQVLSAEGWVNMLAYLRSHDIMKGALPNAVALRRIQKEVADAVGLPVGALTIISASAHIYEQDWVQAEKLLNCTYGKPPETAFRTENADPRGNIIIAADAEAGICVKLMSNAGEKLWERLSTDPNLIMAEIARRGLIIDPAHLMYIGSEIARASMAIASGEKYEQS